MCYMYSLITRIPVLHVLLDVIKLIPIAQLLRVAGALCFIHVLHLFPHYTYSCVTCIIRCYQVNSHSPIAAGGWSVMFYSCVTSIPSLHVFLCYMYY